jgi:hypothetical protein
MQRQQRQLEERLRSAFVRGVCESSVRAHGATRSALTLVSTRPAVLNAEAVAAMGSQGGFFDAVREEQ